MRSYLLEDKYCFKTKTTTKGTQPKYLKEGYFYKVNTLGFNEGYVEYLVSRLLKYSSLNENTYVDYEYVKINGLVGCRSKDFLTSSEEFLTINEIYKRLTGKEDLADYLLYLRSPEERLNFILNLVESVGYNRLKYKEYLNLLMQLDLLISNTDRHVHNYGLIYNKDTGKLRLPPIFDNGRSLIEGYPCTLCGSYEGQVTVFNFPVIPKFFIDYERLLKDLKRIENVYGRSKELDKLRSNLLEYRYLFDNKYNK